MTEPGVLADHHLITRLTNTNGNFSFAAQVRLDFDAVDSAGNPIWDKEDRVTTLGDLLSAQENDDVNQTDSLLGSI
ncbi:hypothetical protein DF186_25545, partial [Enterococcus hirae]